MYVFFPTFTLYDVAPVTFFQVIFNVPFFLLTALIPLTLASFLTAGLFAGVVGCTDGFEGFVGLTEGFVGLTDGCVGLTDGCVGFVSGSVKSGFTPTGLLLALLVTQIVAFPFALLFGKAAKKYRTEKLIRLCILAYLCIALYAIQLDKQYEFWVLAVCVGMFQGAIQALSRSYFARAASVFSRDAWDAASASSERLPSVIGVSVMP